MGPRTGPDIVEGEKKNILALPGIESLTIRLKSRLQP